MNMILRRHFMVVPAFVSNKKNGYISLLTVLIIGTVCSTIAVALLMVGLSASRMSFALQQGALARSLAEACVETSLVKIASQKTYSGSGSITLGSGSCSYTVTQPTGSTRLVAVSATVGTIVKKLQITATVNSSPGQVAVSVTGWQEVP